MKKVVIALFALTALSSALAGPRWWSDSTAVTEPITTEGMRWWST